MRVSERLTRLIEDLRHHTTRTITVARPGKPAEKRAAVDELIRRAQHIVAIGYSVSSDIDGYSATTPGNGSPGSGKGGRATMKVPGDNGPEFVPTSSTEQAVFARLHPNQQNRDRSAEMARQILAELHTATVALASMEAIANRFDRLRDLSDLPDAPQCYIAQVINELPWDEAWTPWCRTNFAGKLPQPLDEERPVSRWGRDFVLHWRRFPTRDEMLTYLERGYVRIHETPSRAR